MSMKDGILDESILDDKKIWGTNENGLKFICLKGMPMDIPGGEHTRPELLTNREDFANCFGGFYTLYDLVFGKYLMVDTYKDQAVAPVTILDDGTYRVETGIPFWGREQLVALKIQLDY